MGLLKSLFGGKKDEPKISAKTSIQQSNTGNVPVKKVSATAQDLILIAVSEKYKVGEKKYPQYFKSSYGIDSPNDRFMALEKKGYIRRATAAESLAIFKTAELKEMALQNGLAADGKKEELCQRIVAGVSPAELDRLVPERFWKTTDSGQNILNQNSYVEFYLEKHLYSLDKIGLDINALERLLSGKPKARIRDALWGEFNRRSMELYKKAVSGRSFHEYCALLRTMAMFLEEEGRHKDALAQYMRYIYYEVNFRGGLAALNEYSYFHDIEKATSTLFMYTEVVPFMVNEITVIENGCQFDSSQLEKFMIDAFSKESDSGLFSPQELAKFVMCGLNGDKDGEKNICVKVMKSAVKKMPKGR